MFLITILGGISQVSADDKIIVKEIPDEFSQKDSMRILIKTTYPSGSFINYNFSLETPYPHRGKLSGKSGTGGGTRISGDRNIFSDKVSLMECIPGDWKLEIWEDDNPDEAYVKIIHIYPFESAYQNGTGDKTSDICSGTRVSNPELSLDPNPGEDGGIFAKGQILYLKGVAPAGSDVGVWIYSGTAIDDFPVYGKVSADCNGNVDAAILSVFDSYTLPSGNYYVYAVSGSPDLADEREMPGSYSEFESLLDTKRGLQYQIFYLDAEDPWISLSCGNGVEAVEGTVLTFEGETNLKDGTLLEVLINPTAVDGPSFGDLIVETIKVEDNGPTNKWIYSLDTSRLGAGEYLISVESPEGLGDAFGIFNVFDSSYAVEDPGDNRLSVTSYKVDENTKDLKASAGEMALKAGLVTGVSFPVVGRV